MPDGNKSSWFTTKHFVISWKSLILLLIDKDNFEKIFNQYEKLIFLDQFSSLLSEEK